MPLTGIRWLQEELKSMLICVDSYEEQNICGRLYHESLEKDTCFKNLMQLVLLIEHVIDELAFPLPATEKRLFSNKENDEKGSFEPTEIDADARSQKGKIGTFKIKIMFRQNSSWQGLITWIEGQREESFRSALELIILLDSALQK